MELKMVKDCKIGCKGCCFPRCGEAGWSCELKAEGVELS
jgi:hypothetical protein